MYVCMKVLYVHTNVFMNAYRYDIRKHKHKIPVATKTIEAHFPQ